MDFFEEWQLVDTDFEWMERASCKGLSTDIFFFDRGDPAPQIKRAKAVCSTCPVKGKCLKFAINNRIYYGYWGDMTSEARKEYARKNGINDY